MRVEHKHDQGNAWKKKDEDSFCWRCFVRFLKLSLRSKLDISRQTDNRKWFFDIFILWFCINFLINDGEIRGIINFLVVWVSKLSWVLNKNHLEKSFFCLIITFWGRLKTRIRIFMTNFNWFSCLEIFVDFLKLKFQQSLKK